MPDMFLVNTGKPLILGNGWGYSSASEDFVLDLFTNSATVSDTTVASDLTPGAWTGYAQVSLPRSSWTTPVVSGTTCTLGTTVVPQWTNTSGSSVNVYGWMLRGAVSGTLYLAQNFSGAPIAIPNTYYLTLYPFQIGLQSY
jgi:hypothetical protein